jgi:predicted nucleotidyltransferase
MEDIKDRLGEYKYNFFKNLQNYLDTEIIFYGSIKRADYFQNASDIDLTIITDNINSIISKLKNYLHLNKSDIKKIVQKYDNNTSTIVSGYKIKYKDDDKNMEFDILIFDEKFKKIVMKNINEINNLQLHMTIILYILKIFYYTLHLLPKTSYLYLKNCLFYMYFNNTIDYYDKNLFTTVILDNFTDMNI